MAGTIGLRLSLDASDSKSQIDALSGAVKKLNESIRDTNNNGGGVPRISSSEHLPRFMGSGEAGLRPGELAAIPDARIAAQIMPRIVPGLTGQSMYGINSYNGQMSPGGILPDGRRMPNTQFNIEQVKDQIEGLGDVIEGLTKDLQEAWKNGDLKSINSISSALENAKSTELSMRNQVKGYEREEKDRADRSDPMKQFGSYMGAHLASQIAQSFVSAGNTIVGSQKTLAGGDYAGAMVQQEKGIRQLIGGGTGTLAGALIGTLVSPGAGTIAGAGIGGKLGDFLGGLSGDFAERDLAFSQNYKNALPAMESFYQRFGTNINGKAGEENGRVALSWYNRASEMSYGTGKTTEELMQAAQNRAAYGNFSGEESLSGARKDIMWERYTGANLSNIQRMSGLALRYGGDTDAIQQAFSGLQASGMGKGQFDEFLNSMQRIMEDGIEKGFVRGADEIASNMSMLSKLSGNDALWTGEQGANRLMRMNEAVSGATELQGVEDLLSFSVARDLIGGNKENFKRLMGGDGTYTDTYVDVMQLLERGVSEELLGGQFEAVRNLEGEGNKAGQIERFRQMYNLNYTGAAKIYEMSLNYDPAKAEEYEKQIKDFQIDPNYQSESVMLQNAITKLTTEGINIGSITFDKVEMPYLKEATEEMEKIHKDLVRKYENETFPLPPQPTVSQIINRDTPESEWKNATNRYFATSPVQSLDQELQAVQNEYNELVNQFAHGDIGIEKYLGNAGSMDAYRVLWDAAVYNKKADPGEADDLRDLLRALEEDFRAMMHHYRPQSGQDVSIMLPDRINVYEMS
jgi:hypothetical protein